MTNPVLSTLDGTVRTITLNRPERLNAINPAMIEALGDAFRFANADERTHVIVFTGAGDRAFCSGDDLLDDDPGRLSENDVRGTVEALQNITRKIVLGDKVVVGAINGWAVGGGFEWAINCDLSIWAESAKGFFPELKWGLFVTGGVTALLPRMVGLTKARDMLMLGETYSAAELLELGLAWRVVPGDQLHVEAAGVARDLAALPQGSLTDMKRQLNRLAAPDLETALAAETGATVRGVLDPETRKRISTFASRA